VLLVQQDHKELRVQPDQQVLLVLKVLRVFKGLLVGLVLKELKVLKDLRLIEDSKPTSTSL
jgi:hypothetical protein